MLTIPAQLLKDLHFRLEGEGLQSIGTFTVRNNVLLFTCSKFLFTKNTLHYLLEVVCSERLLEFPRSGTRQSAALPSLHYTGFELGFLSERLLELLLACILFWTRNCSISDQQWVFQTMRCASGYGLLLSLLWL